MKKWSNRYIGLKSNPRTINIKDREINYIWCCEIAGVGQGTRAVIVFPILKDSRKCAKRFLMGEREGVDITEVGIGDVDSSSKDCWEER